MFSSKESWTISTKIRPLWQRFIYPFVGLILIIVGIILWIIPVVAGFPLIIIGFPLLFCFNLKIENRVRCYMHSLFETAVKKFKRKN